MPLALHMIRSKQPSRAPRTQINPLKIGGRKSRVPTSIGSFASSFDGLRRSDLNGSAVAREAEIELAEPGEFREAAGRGVRARLNGAIVLVGRETWLREEGVDMAGISAGEASKMEGFSTLFVARDGQCIGWIGLEDKTRPDARHATEDLKTLGIRRLTMVTGDRWSVARKVAAELGCTDVEAECLPERKLELVNDIKENGYRVAVVGDGVNDAPALAAGDIGVAMGAAGSDVAINSASIALLSNDLERLPFLIRLSRKARRVVNQNLAFGGVFIVGGLILSGFGYLSPIVAAVLHNVGSFIVIFNSARLVRFGEHLAPHVADDADEEKG